MCGLYGLFARRDHIWKIRVSLKPLNKKILVIHDEDRTPTEKVNDVVLTSIKGKEISVREQVQSLIVFKVPLTLAFVMLKYVSKI